MHCVACVRVLLPSGMCRSPGSGSRARLFPHSRERKHGADAADGQKQVVSFWLFAHLALTLWPNSKRQYMKPIFIAGPCVIESAALLDEVAAELASLRARTGAEFYFKASFDKANRTSIRSFRGPGLERGLQMLADVKDKYGLPLLTDIHESYQAAPAGEVADVLQIPAFLCRQTDLLVAAARTGRVVNIKKAQFLSGEDMRYPVEKCREAGAVDVWLTERGNVYGYNNLVVDFRNIAVMQEIVPRVVMDCTHAVQRPGAADGKTGGDRRFVPAMALAAKAFGANAFFFETHPDPDKALSDGPNMLYLKDLERVVKSLL